MLTVVRHKPLGFGIFKDCAVTCVCFKITGKLVCIPFCHFKIMHKVVAAVFRSCTRNLRNAVYRPEGVEHKLVYFLRCAVSFEYKIKACKAAHWTPVNNLVFPFFAVAEIRCYYMFKRMHCGNVNGGLLIRPF